MKFIGKDLELVREALSLAVDEVHNQIVTCPDVFEYSDELDDIHIAFYWKGSPQGHDAWSKLDDEIYRSKA